MSSIKLIEIIFIATITSIINVKKVYRNLQFRKIFNMRFIIYLLKSLFIPEEQR